MILYIDILFKNLSEVEEPVFLDYIELKHPILGLYKIFAEEDKTYSQYKNRYNYRLKGIVLSTKDKILEGNYQLKIIKESKVVKFDFSEPVEFEILEDAIVDNEFLLENFFKEGNKEIVIPESNLFGTVVNNICLDNRMSYRDLSKEIDVPAEELYKYMYSPTNKIPKWLIDKITTSYKLTDKVLEELEPTIQKYL